MRISRMFAVKVLLLGAITVSTLMVTAFGQQEVDPSWYDPWAPAGKPMAQLAQPRAQPKNLRKTNSVAAERSKSRKQVRVQTNRDSGQQQAMIARK